MSGDKLFRAMRYIDTEYVEEAEFGKFSPRAFDRASEVEKKRRTGFLRKPLMVAAVIAMAAMLVGCGVVYVLHMQDIKLDDREVKVYQSKDTYETVPQQVLTFSGLKGSPNYQAAQEWYEYKKNYCAEHGLNMGIFQSLKGQSMFLPEDFAFYGLYDEDPTTADKLAEIAQKYDLKLIGSRVKARTGKSLFAYLGIDGLLKSDAPAKLKYLEPDYFDGGYLYMDFDIQMEDGEDRWPYGALCSYYYSPKDCFDDTLCVLEDTGDWRERNYTTASGDTVLILTSPSSERAWVFCDREKATISLMVWTEAWENTMTDRQLEQIVDCFDFSIAPKPGDPALLEGLGEGIDTQEQQQTQNGFTIGVKSVKTDGERAFITLGITAPEDISLTKAEKPGFEGENISISTGNWTGVLQPKSGSAPEMMGTGWGARDDGDGLKNTQDLVIQADAQTKDAKTFRPGDTWSLYIENLSITCPNSELMRSEELMTVEGIWQFDITFDDSMMEEVEFVSTPVTTTTAYDEGGEFQQHDLTITSLKLRAYTGSITFDGQTGPLENREENKALFALLDDGSKIQIYHTGGLGQVHGLDIMIDNGEAFPLDKVVAVLLPDGTKLDRVN